MLRRLVGVNQKLPAIHHKSVYLFRLPEATDGFPLFPLAPQRILQVRITACTKTASNLKTQTQPTLRRSL